MTKLFQKLFAATWMLSSRLAALDKLLCKELCEQIFLHPSPHALSDLFEGRSTAGVMLKGRNLDHSIICLNGK